ncbi:MAG: hypothetical protein BWZ02_02399 [Lentisphaerae bacterium ADurb.BinA184]|nr:MAG: hypothetical protein BWZ02_02399 [Lentisphaerae bacterium ADurb.BinA184]
MDTAVIADGMWRLLALNAVASDDGGTGMPEPFRHWYGARLGTKARQYLFGNEAFQNAAEALAFMSLYGTMLEAARLAPAGAASDFLARSRTVHLSAASEALAAWFIRRFVARADVLLAQEAACLLSRGLGVGEVGEAFLYCALGPSAAGGAPGNGADRVADAWADEGLEEARFPWDEDDRAEPAVDGTGADDGLSWGESELMQLAVDPGIRGQAAKLVLKSLTAEQLTVVLAALNRVPGGRGGVAAFRPFLGRTDRLLAEWFEASRLQTQLARRLQNPCKASAAQGGCPSVAPALDRVELTDRGAAVLLQAALPRQAGAGEPTWHLIDMQRGVVLAAGVAAEGRPRHVALARFGDGRQWVRRRGNLDVVGAFFESVAAIPGGCRRVAPCAAWMRWRQRAARFLSEHLLSLCDPVDLRRARSLSRRPAIAWEIYGILRQRGRESRAAGRVAEFAAAFPSLFRIVPAGFLSRVIAPGLPLRAAVPYWSPALRAAACAPCRRYGEARERVMRGVLLSLGATPAELEGLRVTRFLDRFRFYLPFVRQARVREGFFLFVARHWREAGASEALGRIYGYVRRFGHVCDRQSTLASLQRRWEAWAMAADCRRFAMQDGMLTRAFPPPWMPASWTGDTRRIVYLDTPGRLWQHARGEQRNCAFDLTPQVHAGHVQLYRLETLSGQGVGTILVGRGPGGELQLGDCLAACNRPLSRDDTALIAHWFVAAGRGAAAVPAAG